MVKSCCAWKRQIEVSQKKNEKQERSKRLCVERVLRDDLLVMKKERQNILSEEIPSEMKVA